MGLNRVLKYGSKGIGVPGRVVADVRPEQGSHTGTKQAHRRFLVDRLVLEEQEREWSSIPAGQYTVKAVHNSAKANLQLLWTAVCLIHTYWFIQPP